MHALLVVNRNSRLGESDLSEAVATLEGHGFVVRQPALEGVDAIADAIRREGPAADVVIVAGGDGTLNAAAEALVEAGRPVGILPIGTANDLARTLAIPAALPDALAVIIRGHRHRIDLGRVNDKLFFNVASLGLSAELIRHHTPERKRRFWLFAYVLSVIDAYQETRPFTARLRADGTERRLRAIQISVGNGKHYGGGMTIREGATIDDQLLDVYCLRPLGFWRLLALFPALRRGRLERRDEALVFSAREIELWTRRRMRINTDGELTTRTPARFAVVPGALEAFVPEATGSRGEQIDHAAE